MPKKHSKVRLGTAEFKELEAVWYQKLKDAGFEDAEDTTRPHRPLITWENSRVAASAGKWVAEQTHEYYRSASSEEFVANYPFKKPLHKLIWLLHSSGMDIRTIADVVSPCVDALKPTTVSLVIHEIARTLPGSRL